MRTSVLVLALGACAEPAIDMSLKLPQMPANFDLSCVTAVDVAPHVSATEAFDIGIRTFIKEIPDPCVDIEPQTTFEGVRQQLAGRVEFDLLDDLSAIQIRGREGTCKDLPNFHEAIFYGGANYNDGDMTLPLVANVSCNARATLRTRPLDIAAMIADPVHACRGVPAAGETFPALFRPSLFDLTPSIFEGGTGAAGIDANGIASLQSFAQTTGNDACIAVGYDGRPGLIGASCVNKDAALLCGTAGEIELPTFPANFLPQVGVVDDNEYDKVGSFVLGSVWETNPNKPVANATITAPPGVKVDYIELRNGTVEKLAATATGTSGLFLVYTNKVITISIAAPGHQTRTMTVAGSPGFPGDALAVLPKL